MTAKFQEKFETWLSRHEHAVKDSSSEPASPGESEPMSPLVDVPSLEIEEEKIAGNALPEMATEESEPKQVRKSRIGYLPVCSYRN